MTKNYILQTNPFKVPTTDGKTILEHFGHATSGNANVSIAYMVAPAGWSEPPQTPEFEEYTLVISGKKQFTIAGEMVVLEAGQSIKIEPNVRVQYANPFDEPCCYVSVCMPAFHPDTVHREEE
ncbi:MAG: cupin [Flavobacterium sp. BFFFF2]|nr:MAG: cupin [Flavobacterium sp. BFFFF2]